MKAHASGRGAERCFQSTDNKADILLAKIIKEHYCTSARVRYMYQNKYITCTKGHQAYVHDGQNGNQQGTEINFSNVGMFLDFSTL